MTYICSICNWQDIDIEPRHFYTFRAERNLSGEMIKLGVCSNCVRHLKQILENTDIFAN